MTARIRAPHTRRRWLPGAIAVGLLAFVVSGALVLSRERAQALINCSVHGNTADELQLRDMILGWRVQYVPNTDPGNPLVLSGPLNAAAAGYAQYLADNPEAAGHAADGQTASERAIQCGYPAELAFGDETVAVVHGAGASLTPQQALDQMAAESYYEAHMRVPNQLGLPSSLPVHCMGIASAVSPDGTGAAYVAMFMAASTECPQAVAVTTPTPVATFPGVTLTPTPTATLARLSKPTATPTATAPAVANYGRSLEIDAGWNLVTLPNGPVADILDTARGCYAVVYEWDGSRWLRYGPGLPAYADDFQYSDGTPVWILGNAAACGVVHI